MELFSIEILRKNSVFKTVTDLFVTCLTSTLNAPMCNLPELGKLLLSSQNILEY